MWNAKENTKAKPACTSRELDTAIADDLLKQQINDAKIKAMTDRVDYDTFKARVSVAHLRPLQDPNIVDRTSLPAWSFNPDGTKAKITEDVTTSLKSLSTEEPLGVPSKSSDFERTWRRNVKTEAEKYKYVLLIPPESYPKIFKVEIASPLLGDVLLALEACCLKEARPAEEGTGEAAQVLAVLRGLSESVGQPFLATLTCVLALSLGHE
ncbi:hypothetical protein CYMTET_33211, partial [Cymbomonas tetramitiformis]